MKLFFGMLVVGWLFSSGSLLAQETLAPAVQGFSPCMGPGPGAGMGRCYGRGMMNGMTPEQRQQRWAEMHQQGYGPGMGQGYGRGMMHRMTPEQRQQHWEQMQQQGYGPGMGRGMTPEQRQQHWEQMRQRGYSPGMGRGYGRGMMYGTPPASPAEN